MQKPITDQDRKRAEVCLNKCGGCKKARKNQSGFWFWFVKSIEGGACPYCKAYAKVYGRKPHEPLAEST
jgi:hypothetical protein